MMIYSKILNIVLVLCVIVLLVANRQETEKSTTNKEVVLEATDYSIGEKVNLGAEPALYPTPTTVVGTTVEGKVNWIAIAHIGHIGTKGLILSSGKSHYSNIGIKKNMTLSVNMVSEAMLVKADYVGLESGAEVDKSSVFEYFIGELQGAPMIKESPITMECKVVDIYETEHHDNFVVEVVNTYANASILKEGENIDFTKVKPVLFEMSGRQYLLTGDVVGNAWKEGEKYIAHE